MQSRPLSVSPWRWLPVLLWSFVLACGGPQPRSERSFAEISELVRGKTAGEVRYLLGEPDSRQVVFDADERWIWWNYTYLDGNDCPPELRGRVVHLEILFRNPRREAGARRRLAEWPVDDAYGVNFRVPGREG